MKKAYSTGYHELPRLPLVRGSGNVWPISGWISGDLSRVKYAQIKINNFAQDFLELFQLANPIEGIDFFGRVLRSNCYQFCHFIYSKDIEDDLIEVNIRLHVDDDVVDLPLPSLPIASQIVQEAQVFPQAEFGICMTTYNPNERLFRAQIDSILSQTEKSWHLVINDDHSDANHFAMIRQITKNDKRISLFRNEQNLGFYYNFETCLNRVHKQFKFILLADQDDYWTTEKISKLKSGIGDNLLIFNDLEIRNENNQLVSPTFWNQRSNHYQNTQSLFIANTVTGSASMFSSELMNRLLPFPSKLGNAFHDHWLAVAAGIDDRITYWPESLQSYIQHENNVTGHGRFKEANMTHSTLSMLSLQRMKAVVALQFDNKRALQFIQNNLKVYFDSYLRRKLNYEILISRLPYARRKKLDRIFSAENKAINELLKLHWKVYKNSWMTNNIELSYVNAIEVVKQISIKYDKNITGNKP